MGAVSLQQMSDRIAALLEERLGVRGNGLAAKLKKAGRRLPKKVQEAGATLAQAAEMAQNPRFLMRINEEAVAEAYDLCVRHLSAIDRWDRRKGAILGVTTSIFFSLLVVAALVVAVLVWRGLV